MAADEPYDMLPHREIVELKKQIKDLKSGSGKKHSPDLLNSMSTLVRIMDSMLSLFTKTAEELKNEDNQGSGDLNVVNSKLDEIMEQNKTIAEGMVAVSDIVNDFIEAKKPRPSYPAPRFNPTPQEPMQQPPRPNFPEPIPQNQGPVPMPAMPFSEVSRKPKKKGLFGKMKK